MIETGRPVAEIARELEINEGTLGSWVNEWLTCTVTSTPGAIVHHDRGTQVRIR